MICLLFNKNCNDPVMINCHKSITFCFELLNYVNFSLINRPQARYNDVVSTSNRMLMYVMCWKIMSHR